MKAPNEKILKYNNMKKWDVILANPPFNLGEKMLTKWFDLADTICTIQPSTWLLGKKKTKSICSHLNSGEFNDDIESINGSEYFNAGISGVMAVQFFEKNITKHNTCNIVFDRKQYTKTDDISLTSNDELLSEFTDKIIKLAKKDNLNNHLTYSPGLLSHSPGIKQHTEYKPNDMWYCIRMVKQSHDLCILPTSSETPIKYKEIGYKTVQGKKKNGDIINKPFMEYYYHFDDIHTAKNCINYFKTMFVRILLYQYMTQTQNFLDTTTQFIPWFDFSDSMFNGTPEEIDIALFKKYHISQNIVNHIIEILPNYYKLDLSKYIL